MLTEVKVYLTDKHKASLTDNKKSTVFYGYWCSKNAK